MCPSRAGSACFGAGEWCWEHPYPMSNELFVAFTTPDAGGVWAAGAGPTLLHWDNGVVTNKTSLLTQRTPSNPYEEPAAIIGAAVVNDGVFLVGNRIDLLQAVGDSGFRSSRTNDWDMIGADSRGRLYGVASTSRGILQRLATTGVDPIQLRFDPASDNSTRIFAVGFDSSDTAFVTTGGDNQAFRFDVSALGDGGTTPVAVDAGLLRGVGGFLGPVARLQDGGAIVGGVNLLYAHDGQNWGDAGLVPFGGSFTEALVPSGSSLWVFGGSGNTFEANSGSSAIAVPTSVWGGTAAPDGNAWVVGSRGLLGLVTTSGATLATAIYSSGVRDLFVTDQVTFAAQNESILDRAGGSWLQRGEFSGPNGRTWIAVAVVAKPGGGHVVWAVDQTGALYRDDGLGSALRVLELAPPLVDYFPRSAASLPLPDGGALLGVGRAILRLTETTALNFDGGTISSGILPDGGTPPELVSVPVNMISGLAATALTLVVTGHMAENGPSAIYSAEPGGNWTQRWATLAMQRIEDVTACPGGSFVIAGNNGLLKRLNPNGTTLSDGWAQPYQPPPGVDFASAWCGPNDEAWVLARGGDVLRFGGSGVPVRERTGWGRRDENSDPIEASTIRGNSTFLFISGGSSALLSRPVCP